ncbi:polysaccharide deacetylase family protein [Streptomyces meridianus]|uniref:Polysaccharide deacetylase family protein n=1 Tax=Streptomyces meridianus TaxID=2938945 RepID=A0ABT0XDM9_9ACTN|nr:polysaccharide deacetylase family protein [Streptomyces meridianus]MCM2580023.1 polysaccharide deacetylase family protein [Streptomyces meridianus]
MNRYLTSCHRARGRQAGTLPAPPGARTPRSRRVLRRAVAAAAVASALLLPTTAGAVPHRGPATAAAPAQLAPERAPSPVEHLFGSDNRRIPTDEKVVALTFNAAWNDAGLDTILAELRRRRVPATFFLTGDFADRHPEAARAMAAEHGIGNHSYNHPQFAELSSQEMTDEVMRADDAIRRATGAEPLPFFRFPYSETTEQGIAHVNALGFADIEFTADTNGYLGAAGGMTVDRAVARAVDALAPGEIVQMHVGASDGQGPVLDAEALPRIIDAVQERGYRIVDLRTLLAADTV